MKEGKMGMWLAAVWCWAGCALGAMEAPQRTLVLVDNKAFEETHSVFFDLLRAHNHELKFQMYYDKLNLQQYGTYAFDNIIFFVPSGTRAKGSSSVKSPILTIKNVLEFFDVPGKNLMIVADPAVYTFTRKLANEFGADFDPQGSFVREGHSFDKDMVTAQVMDESERIFATTKGVSYNGIGMTLDPRNYRAFSILKPERSAFSADEAGKIVGEGPKITLVAGYHGLNNNRVTITGSTLMCSNMQFAKTAKGTLPSTSPNHAFCEELVAWNFGETGQLKIAQIMHKEANSSTPNPSEYKIKTDIQYYADFLEWDARGKKWVPFEDAEAQLEFVMLDPIYRIPLRQVERGKATYTAELRTPDRLGVFQFKVNYTRRGFTTVTAATKVSVRQVHWDEMPRFMPAAIPYYLSVFLTILAFFLFVLLFIFSKDDHKSKSDQSTLMV